MKLGDKVDRAVLSEQLEAHQAMMRSETRYRRLFETAQDGILILDPTTRKITEANPYITRLLGYPREELLGKELWEIGLHKDERASNAAFIELRTTGYIRYDDLPLQTKAGERREVEFVSNLYEEGDQVTIQCNIRDITDRKRATVALSHAISKLQAAQVVTEHASRAKDDFLAALSHELRTPLTPVLMTAAALRDDPRLPSEVREQLGMMERNIALEARLIDDLLDVTMISHGKLQLRTEACDAHSLIGLAAEIVRNHARLKHISIERVFHAKRSGLMADGARFQQVIWNLLRNAVKFTPENGRVTITTRDQVGPDGAPWFRVEISDTGLGIDPDRLDKIFAPFEQGSVAGQPRLGGMGLGLSIARSVVELHGGRIFAESPGAKQGATFIVETPSATVPPGGILDPETRSANDAKPHLGIAAAIPLRLLLVEDHVPTLQTISRLLARAGHDVVAVTTVADALAAAKTRVFDLVISDLGLPDGTGHELMEQLRQAHGLRGIALSGYGMEDDVARSQASGFVAHLVKPVTIAELRQVIADFAAGAQNRPPASGSGAT